MFEWFEWFFEQHPVILAIVEFVVLTAICIFAFYMAKLDVDRMLQSQIDKSLEWGEDDEDMAEDERMTQSQIDKSLE